MDRRVTREEIEGRIGSIPDDFRLYFEPGPEILPETLASLDLDAVATDGQRGIVYEVAVGRRALQDDEKVAQVRRLRKAIQLTPGWTFELIILPEPPPESLPLVEIDRRIEEIEAALALSSGDAASDVVLDGLFLVGFAVLEACMARIAFSAGADYQPMAARIGAVLTEEGVLSQDQLDRVRAFQDRRNGIAHGIRQSHTLRGDMHDLLALIREVRSLVDQPIGG